MQEDAAGALAAWGPTHPNCSSQSLTSPSFTSSSSSSLASSLAYSFGHLHHHICQSLVAPGNLRARASQTSLLVLVDVEYKSGFPAQCTRVLANFNHYGVLRHKCVLHCMALKRGSAIAGNLRCYGGIFPPLPKFTCYAPLLLMPFLCILTPKGRYPLLTVYEYG